MTNNFSIAHIHTTGPNTDRDFIIQLGVLPLDGKNEPFIQQFKPECSLSRSTRVRSGLKDKDLEQKPLFGTASSNWKKILAPYQTLFVLRTGNGDEINWLKKVVVDHELEINVIDLGRLTQFFLPQVKEHSFIDLYKRFLKKPYRSNKNIMIETLQLGEKLLREIMYLFSNSDSS